MIYQSTPDYYNDFISHERSHKYIDKYKGKNGRWVYVYSRKNPYEAMNEGMENLRKGVRGAARTAAVGALYANSKFNNYMNRKAKKAAGYALKKNAQFNNYMNGKVTSAGKKVGSEVSRIGRRAASSVTKPVSAAKKNAKSMYNTAAGKASSAYGSAKSTYGKASSAAKKTYNSAKSTYNKASKATKNTYNSAKNKYNSAVKAVNKFNSDANKAWDNSDAAVYYRALKNARKRIKSRKKASK